MSRNQDRKTPHALQRRLSRSTAIAAGGAALASLLMILSPAAAASQANLGLHAPYKGSVAPNDDVFVTGCGKSSTARAWHFALASGIGGAASKGRAGDCKKSVQSPGQSSSSGNYGGVTVAVGLPRLAPSVTNVSATVDAKYATTLSVSAGTGLACHAQLGSFTYTYLNWGWNYTAAGGFANSAYLDNYSYSGLPANYSYNSSYNLAGIPYPFNLSGTTLLSIDYGFYVYGICEALAYGALGVYGYLEDLSTGASTYESGSSIGSIYSAEIDVYNETNYGCFADFYWDGPANVTYGNTTYVCYNYNTTLTSFVYVAAPYSYFSAGSNSSLTWGGPGSATGAVWFDGPFHPHHRYALDLTFYASQYVTNSWAKGFASFSFSAATGLKLSSLKIS
jgi:hypothetical protein